MSSAKRIEELRHKVNSLLPVYKSCLYRYSLLAYSRSLLDLADAIVTLSDTGKLSGIPILYRTFSETFVDFHNLSTDKLYGYRLQSNRLKEWIKVLDNLDPKHLSWLKESAELDDLDGFKEQLLKEKSDLNEKYKPIKIGAKFELAGLKDFYDTVYNELCSDSHSNLRSVFSRLYLDESDLKVQLCIETIPQALKELEETLVQVFRIDS
ncbi:TPA: DUF5677 domain-containing protein [Vibrio parahaemolyticus]|uniref:DUF5677 domain-containing protein n=1 Tax=Vibrio parahaemolyticus TaxID=670 RepID=UPI001123FA5A|nr:DUF5677 domain-containing protein [Vibrio parahaemolyticus]EHE7894601.1 hypothetical protein [Vibrio parahaemolyticus]EHK7404489.1 hypothetical protein [Vibrio parahaemolyticus]EHR5465028.1 hypothetical protein [Vibrio parahaemolyticus]EJC6798882.1 hypothetical protein [Vibrio parahaemolyticus]EJC7052364.1 hypothetical protein [Vibrio parahaemolyticus]